MRWQDLNNSDFKRSLKTFQFDSMARGGGAHWRVSGDLHGPFKFTFTYLPTYLLTYLLTSLLSSRTYCIVSYSGAACGLSLCY